MSREAYIVNNIVKDIIKYSDSLCVAVSSVLSRHKFVNDLSRSIVPIVALEKKVHHQ